MGNVQPEKKKEKDTKEQIYQENNMDQVPSTCSLVTVSAQEPLANKFLSSRYKAKGSILIASKNLLVDSSLAIIHSPLTPEIQNSSFSNIQGQEDMKFVNSMEKEVEKRNQSINLSQVLTPSFERVAIDQTRFISIKYTSIYKDYDFLREIGHGSFGKVFEVCQKVSGELRAAKKLFKGKLKKNDYSSLFNELEILKQMDHPNIIKLYDIYQDKKWLYVVTELCEGGTLVDLIDRRQLKEDQVRIIMTQLLSAVSYLHSNGILHRDIKLENVVMVSKAVGESLINNQIKLIDFGISVNMKKNTPSDQLIGTLIYVPPQSFKGVVNMGWDIWSCGILCYKLATGKNPYLFNDEGELKIKIQKAAINNFPLSKLSPPLKKFINRMLAKEHHSRTTAKKALKDQWMQKNRDSQRMEGENAKKTMSLLRSYSAQNNLISVIQGYLVAKKVNQSERQELAALFQSIDKDHSGIIEVQELKKFYQQNSDNYNQQEVNALIIKMDKNKSGKIDFNQFIGAMCEKRKLYQLESLSEAFDFFDTDSSGCLSIDQVRKLLQGVQNEEFKNLFQGLDQDGDENISKKEFLLYFQKLINQ